MKAKALRRSMRWRIFELHALSAMVQVNNVQLANLYNLQQSHSVEQLT